MRGTKTITASALLALAVSAFGADADYFPLQTGNQWVYRSAGRVGAESTTAEAAGTENIGGRQYTVVRGLTGADARLRMSPEGTLFLYDPESRQEKVWAAFGTPEGSSYETSLDPCVKTAMVVSRNARYEGPVGNLDGVIEIRYPPAGCADAGITRELYARGIGLLLRETTTIAGPVRTELVYARIGGVNVFSEKNLQFNIALDRAVAAPGATVGVRLTLANTLPQPLELTFPSGQDYDLVMRDEKGTVVYQWSAGKAFIMIFRQLKFGPGEKTFSFDVPAPSAPGKYVLEGWLATDPRQFVASTALEVARQ